MRQQIKQDYVYDVGNPIADKVHLVPESSPRAPSLARAEACVSGMKQAYCRDLVSEIDEMESLIKRVAAVAGSDCAVEQSRMSEIAGNIKGQAGTFQYELITRIAADLYRLLHRVRLDDTGAITHIRHHLAAMRVVLERELMGLGGDMGERLMATLTRR
jgi:hypothetical protein